MDTIKEHNDALDSFLATGGRYYKNWHGSPDSDKRLAPYIKLISEELGYLAGLGCNVLEISPQGGRWTDQILTIMGEVGYPRRMTYSLIGTPTEHNLVARDVLRYRFVKNDEPFHFSGLYTIRSRGCGCLLVFTRDHTRFYPYSIFTCFDHPVFTQKEQSTYLSDMITYYLPYLSNGALLLFNIHIERRLEVLDFLTMNQILLRLLVQDGDTYYLAARKDTRSDEPPEVSINRTAATDHKLQPDNRQPVFWDSSKGGFGFGKRASSGESSP